MAEAGRARKGKRESIPGQFAWRLTEMLESPAYRALSLSAHRVLARLEIEIAHHGGKDNGRLPCTFDQLHEYGVHRDAIAPAIRETVALGFVEVTEAGRAGNAAWRRPTLFRLTYRHTQKIEPTNEWRKIETVADADRLAKAARKTENQSWKPDHNSVRKPDHKRQFCGPETMTTAHSPETMTTSISRVHARSRPDPVTDAVLQSKLVRGPGR